MPKKWGYTPYADSEMLCRLDDGRIVPYDTAAPSTELLGIDLSRFELIGHGTTYSIGGVLQEGKTPLYFFKYKE